MNESQGSEFWMNSESNNLIPCGKNLLNFPSRAPVVAKHSISLSIYTYMWYKWTNYRYV